MFMVSLLVFSMSVSMVRRRRSFVMSSGITPATSSSSSIAVFIVVTPFLYSFSIILTYRVFNSTTAASFSGTAVCISLFDSYYGLIIYRSNVLL